ncbi:DnaA N-terminal domain-containing protein, partial [Elstera sp.]|uniref:DnaA N-terminal domain-containing protein n=1 Tax=Elstera sp. TaxID=1916664 RepID=UPI0037C0D3F3
MPPSAGLSPASLGSDAIGGLPVAMLESWQRVRMRLVSEVGEAAFKSWLAPLALQDVTDGAVRLSLPTRFMRDWVATHYVDRVRRLLTEEMPGLRSVDLVVAAKLKPIAPGALLAAPAMAAPILPPRDPQAPAIVRAAQRPEVSEVDPLSPDQVSVPLDPRLTFETFVVGKPNELAFAAARRVAESATVSFNPLFLYGGV